MTEIRDLDGTATLHAYRDRTLSPREAVADALDRIERFAPDLDAFVRVDRDGAMAAAAASEARWSRGEPRGPLDGITFTVKDNIAWAGHPMRRGSLTTADTPAAENAPIVDRLLEAGAIPLAKTTMPEFGWKGLGDSTQTGSTRNPWDTRMTTGGSSAGPRRRRRSISGSSISAPTGRARSASRPPSAASTGSNPASAGCRPSRPRPSGRWRISAR